MIRLESMPDAPGPDLTRLTEAAAAGGPLAGLGSPAVAGAASPELAVGPEDLLGPPPAPDQALDAVGTGEPAAQPAASAAPPPAASRAGPVPVPVALDSPALAQAAPQLEACVIPPRRGLERERSWVRQAMSHQYDAAAAAVLRMLSEMPGLRTSASPAADLLTELVAARLYLTGQPQQVDDMVRTATVGPHVPFGRCVAAGLRRLPSYRGPTRLRATLAEAEWQWYGHRDLVTEWAFCPALADGRVRLPGTVDFLIWSMTARRANLLEPSVQSQVIFLPGTNFKVLAVQAGEQREVLLREVSAAEIGADGHLADGPRPLDQVALSGLERASGLWRQEPPAGELPERYASRFASPPGLAVRTRASAGSVTGPGVG